MQELNKRSKIGVVGAGTMGNGIAQLAATHGHHVVLHDASAGALERGTTSIVKSLARLVEKGRTTEEESNAIRRRISLAGGDAADAASFDALRGCDLVIEAIVEVLEAKRNLFARLEAVIGNHPILATNTSSLSITAIGAACAHPERVVGIHFFNPPVVMPLVEIVPSLATTEAVATSVRQLVDSWGKTTVLASDTPG